MCHKKPLSEEALRAMFDPGGASPMRNVLFANYEVDVFLRRESFHSDRAARLENYNLGKDDLHKIRHLEVITSAWEFGFTILYMLRRCAIARHTIRLVKWADGATEESFEGHLILNLKRTEMLHSVRLVAGGKEVKTSKDVTRTAKNTQLVSHVWERRTGHDLDTSLDPSQWVEV